MKRVCYFVAAMFMMASCAVGEKDLVFPDGGYMGGDYTGSTAEGTPGDEYGEEPGNMENHAGLVTAGEWCDLENWDFWGKLTSDDTFGQNFAYWGWWTNHRVAVRVLGTDNVTPQCGVTCYLSQNGEVIWQAVTNNKGECNLWYSPFANVEMDSTAMFSVYACTTSEAQPAYFTGMQDTTITWNVRKLNAEERAGVDIAFFVDATGSMGDEIAFLKADVIDIINSINCTDVRTAALFYRDKGDDYIVRTSNFDANVQNTANFISQQCAVGGGDWPEAVHTALEAGLQELSWREDCRVKIAFMLLDAPPHHEDEVLESIHRSVKQYAANGIRLIPIAASGIDKNTEFLLRYFAITTDGTYVFITNDSGIGNDHIQPTVGFYQVELLRDLIIRLINQYTA